MPSALNVTCRAPAVFSTLWHQLMACLRRANIGSCRRQEFLRMSLLGDSGFSLRVSGTPWAAFAPLSGAKWTQYAQGEFCALKVPPTGGPLRARQPRGSCRRLMPHMPALHLHCDPDAL